MIDCDAESVVYDRMGVVSRLLDPFIANSLDGKGQRSITMRASFFHHY